MFYNNKHFRKLIRQILKIYWFLIFYGFSPLVRNKKTKDSGSDWDKHYSIKLFSHSFQNYLISKDFINSLPADIFKYFYNSNFIVDFGCGTGELLFLLNKRFKGKLFLGCDIAESALNFAKARYGNKNIDFKTIKKIQELDQYFLKADILICSNTLEHFKDPFKIVDELLRRCKYLGIIVPYRQTLGDVYEYEGGLGHVFSFEKESFKNYSVLNSFIFRSIGWDYSVGQEEPKQIVYFLKSANPE
jgi:ubiquinone/menaquinone biosynthesis C-methylase UbiE